jgi:hypothetical protein
MQKKKSLIETLSEDPRLQDIKVYLDKVRQLPPDVPPSYDELRSLLDKLSFGMQI